MSFIKNKNFNYNAMNSSPATKRRRQDETPDDQSNESNLSTKLTPSYVVHARNLDESVSEIDITRALSKYGLISCIKMMPKKRQALIEFCEITSSISCVNDANRLQVIIKGVITYINYSANQKIMPQNGNEKEIISKSNILLFKVSNAIYPINVQVIKKICLPIGSKVLKIVIDRTNIINKCIEALVEFETSESAHIVKEKLDGEDIYTDCCTLKIDYYLKSSKLNVTKNDNDNWDHSIELKEQHDSNVKNNIKNNNLNTNDNQNNLRIYSNNRNNTSLNKNIPSLMPKNFQSTNINNNSNYNRNSNNPIVLMILNLCMERFNCDRLFNLLCLYGNVDRIKFLMGKEGSAMAQLSNADAIINVLNSLNNTYIFGKKFGIHLSKQNELNPMIKPSELMDGTPSYKDYSSNRTNRYQNPEAAQKNKPVPPSNIIHWFNAPPGISEKQIIEIFSNSGGKVPCKVKVFPKKSEKSSTGLAEWDSITDCIESLVLANHYEINHQSSKFPYILKLCFSATPIVDNISN